MNILRPAQREMQKSGPDSRIAEAINQNEAAELTILGVRLEGDRLGELEFRRLQSH